MLSWLAGAVVAFAVGSDAADEDDPEELLELLGEKPVWATFYPQLDQPGSYGMYNIYDLGDCREAPWFDEAIANIGATANYPDSIRFNVRRLIVNEVTHELEYLQDNKHEADALWEQHPMSKKMFWPGPFRVVIESSIADYLQRERNQ